MQKTHFPLVQVLSHCALCVLDSSEISQEVEILVTASFSREPGVLHNFRAHPSQRVQRAMPFLEVHCTLLRRQAPSPPCTFPAVSGPRKLICLSEAVEAAVVELS